MIDVPIRSLFTEAEFQIPEYKTDGAAAVDLRARIDEPIIIPEGVVVSIPLGIHIDLTGSPGVAALLIPRSGLGSRGFTLMNGVGLIDNDYHGEISATMVNQSDSELRVNRGDRIAQLMFVPFQQAQFRRVETFTTTTKRGERGHGHTGTA